MENSAPSLKIFRTKFLTSALHNGRYWQVSGASPTKLQEILDNAVPEKNEESRKVRHEHI